MNKLKSVEIALIFGVVVALLAGRGIAAQQEELADTMIRLHVIANSDSDRDQADKLAVRDAILVLVKEYGEQADTVSEMADILESHLPELEAAGEVVLRNRDSTHSVRASVTDCYFPTKAYTGFALPAGSYRALRLEIGAGEGANWWCVAFPPLCVGSCAESVEQAVEAGFFTQEQGEFLAGNETGYILKFRCMELLGQIKERLCPG